MENTQFNWSQSIPIWWSFFWRATLLGALVGALLGTISGIILVAIGKPEHAELAGGLLGYVAAIPVSIYCFKLVLNKSFKGYSLQFVKDKPESSTELQ